MTNRLDISLETLLWKTAYSHFGPSDFREALFEIWKGSVLPARATVEYLDENSVGSELLSIARAVQIAVGAVVPYRETSPDRLILYCRHAQDLADGLLLRMPIRQLPQALRGVRLEREIGL